MLKIKRIEAIAVALPMAKPMKMAGVEIRTADNLLVRVEAADGSVGWGEAASAPHMTGETVESMVAAVRYLAPAIEGRNVEDLPSIESDWAFAMYGNHAAKSAIEMALQDLTAKAAGIPAWKLFGEQRRERMAVPRRRSRSPPTPRLCAASVGARTARWSSCRSCASPR